MRVAAFMSGSGTNIRKLLERERDLKARDGDAPFHVLFIFSDRSDGTCQGEKIALEAGIPYFSFDIRAFHKERKLKRSVLTPEGLEARKAYDRVAATLVRAFGIDVIALGGYMSYITLNRCVNVHPADLSVLDEDGRRKYVGDHAVRDAVLGGEQVLRSSTLWTDEGVDTGPLLMVSAPVSVELTEPVTVLQEDPEKLERISDAHQEQLKETGDWIIFPKTVEMIAEGRFALDEQNRVYVDGEAVPRGFRANPD
jgi:folate-dependent phosphoribosylglycinamide formyltransferase PurN